MSCGYEVADWYCPVISLLKGLSVVLIVVIIGLYYYFRGYKDGHSDGLKEKSKIGEKSKC